MFRSTTIHDIVRNWEKVLEKNPTKGKKILLNHIKQINEKIEGDNSNDYINYVYREFSLDELKAITKKLENLSQGISNRIYTSDILKDDEWLLVSV